MAHVAKLDARIPKPELIAYVTKAYVAASCESPQVISGHIETGEPSSCPTGAIAAYAFAEELVARIPTSVVATAVSDSLVARMPETQVAFGSFGTIIDPCS